MFDLSSADKHVLTVHATVRYRVTQLEQLAVFRHLPIKPVNQIKGIAGEVLRNVFSELTAGDACKHPVVQRAVNKAIADDAAANNQQLTSFSIESIQVGLVETAQILLEETDTDIVDG
jgi:regulator of protease activity HflC (stomatin/prohibitin superfamily)